MKKDRDYIFIDICLGLIVFYLVAIVIVEIATKKDVDIIQVISCAIATIAILVSMILVQKQNKTSIDISKEQRFIEGKTKISKAFLMIKSINSIIEEGWKKHTSELDRQKKGDDKSVIAKNIADIDDRIVQVLEKALDDVYECESFLIANGLDVDWNIKNYEKTLIERADEYAYESIRLHNEPDLNNLEKELNAIEDKWCDKVEENLISKLKEKIEVDIVNKEIKTPIIFLNNGIALVLLAAVFTIYMCISKLCDFGIATIFVKCLNCAAYIDVALCFDYLVFKKINNKYFRCFIIVMITLILILLGIFEFIPKK